jgi:hypothetical protein
MSPNLATALELADLGIPIFPAIASWDVADQKFTKKPLLIGWQTLASTEPEQLKAWWQDFPDAIPGIELARAKLIVVDLDRHPGGADGVANFKALLNGRRLPPSPTTRTPSGGFHLFFRQPAGVPLGNGRGDLPPGIDVRGRGGWVAAPNSIVDRGTWRALPNRPPLNAAPELPDWLLAIIRPAPKPRPIIKLSDNPDGRLRGLCRRVINASTGERNSVLFWAACRAKEMGGSTFAAMMLEQAAVGAGLPGSEARATIKSAFERRE